MTTICADPVAHKESEAYGIFHECYEGQAQNFKQRGYAMVPPKPPYAVIDSSILVLDHGQVSLIDAMADDIKVVGSARVSTRHAWAEASKGIESDGKLIRYLMKNGHGSPFEHAVFQFFIRLPLFVRSEWQRHRIGSFNEQSGRYAEFEPVFYIPDRVRVQDPVNKQSSVPTSDDSLNLAVRVKLETSYEFAFRSYKHMLERGVAREIARLVLPTALYTTMWWTVNCRSLMNFVALRNSDSAQWEIRQFAIAVEEMFAAQMPLTYTAFVSGGRVAP